MLGMKFSEISSEEWLDLQPYLDTCLLPVTGLVGSEQPHEATTALEQLRDIMDLIEIPYKGRVVTYPAFHFYEESLASGMLTEVCSKLRRTGFKHIIIVAPKRDLLSQHCGEDFLLQPESDGSLPSKSEVANWMRSLWNGQAT